MTSGDTSTSIRALRNADIAWDGDYVGLRPTLGGEASARLLELGESAIPALVAAAADPERFVAVHVLLTLMTGVEYETSPAWNGLEVDLGADGSVAIDDRQRDRLARRWQRWREHEPRSARLPSAD